ncbi:hypothetical protein G3I59_44220 [Amycolatopsis rubida]|uniref:Uncharacterized protein n=1 Tax=Amycolatopsis rubida TaxID=112413 RepID=A0ABX0CBN0_9PSEU|nr:MULTISPECIES: hypothetical protein [Amycolatopsis]MYW97441.1 hypothetical protein [Amycolatopsis rubida]NEC62426.1 hypothetical protein [Amycolatopsis rubida]OAP21587.1 hypothetical protein A4R44_07610 [Amycolatopsis sp. M39]
MIGSYTERLTVPNRITRADGHAFTTYSPTYETYEPSLVDLVVREDGGLRLTCGRGTFPWQKQSYPPSDPAPVVVPAVVLGLTHTFLAPAGQLGDEHAAYQGQWRLGLRVDRMRNVLAADKMSPGMGWYAHPYSRDDYVRVTSASTGQLVETQREIAERLVAPLLRGLDVADTYIPVKPD